jgi:NPCBM/NEW2 domain
LNRGTEGENILMRVAHSIAVVSFLAAALIRPESASAQQLRYSAQFASGKRINGTEIRNWHEPQAEPNLENVKLIFPNDRALWVEDVTIPPAPLPAAFVELFGGDRMPGRVVEYRSGQESLHRKTPPALVVIPEAAIDWPETRRFGGLPVTARFVRRVVWQKRDDDRYRPGTLFYADGRQVEYRSLRWSTSSIRLLIDSETRDVPFNQIAELHLPRVDPWEAWFSQLAALLPDLNGSIQEIETADGLRVTASSSRFYPTHRGDAGNPDHWIQGVQPVWSAEPLWIKHRQIRLRRFFLPHEVPLSAIEPGRVVQRTNLSAGWNWQVDRNVYALPMRCADQPFAWGMGVHAYSEMSYDLPAVIRSFRSQYGLDWSAGAGGCVRASIFSGPAGAQLLHRSEHIIGSERVFDTGPLGIAGAKQLTLVVDPAENDRPPGADPFEIRDSFDWLQPVLELDPEGLRLEIERRFDAPLWTWLGWTVADLKSKPCVVSLAWDQQRPPAARLRTEVIPREGFSAWSRRIEFRAGDRFLSLSVNRLEKEVGPSRIQVRIGGKAVGEFEVPIQNSPLAPDPLLVPIERFRGQTLDVEIVQIPTAPQARVEWRGIGIASRDPVVFEAFEDDPEFLETLKAGGGTARLDATEKFAGAVSLLVTPDDRHNAAIPGWNLPIRSEPQPGEYRFIRFVWKKRGGKQIGLHLAEGGRFAPIDERNLKESLRYQAGRGTEPDYGKSHILRDQPPDQWEPVTRDLFNDFGAFDLTGLRLACGDGEAAWFDQIYLGRAWHDLDRVANRVKNPPPDPLANQSPEVKANTELVAVDPVRFGEVVSQVAPEFSTAASEQGVWLLKTFEGKNRVLRTHPPAQGVPCVLRSAVAVPTGKRTELRLTVTHNPNADWQLVVIANGERLHDSLISKDAAQNGWVDVTVDLTKFAGHNVVLEVHNHPNNWSYEYAYWNRVEVVSQ